MAENAREKSFGYIGAALGLVAGLAWNEAIKAFIDYILPLGQDSVWAKFIYAVVVTIIVVIAISMLDRFARKK